MRPDQLPSLLDHCLAGLYVLSGDRILWANARAAEMVGCKPEELVGGSFLPFVYPPDLPLVKARAKAGAPYVIRAVRRDGQLVYLEAHQRAVQIDGKPLISGAVLDVTERVRADAASRVTGYAREELLGRNWFDLCVAEDQRERRKAGYVDGLKGGTFNLLEEREVLTRSASRTDA